MYAYIKGSLEVKSKGYVVVETNSGIGYKIFMSDSSTEKIGEIGDSVKVYTYYLVRENEISLYGFLTNEELRMFELLLLVSGVGAKSAITVLSSIEPSCFALAVISNDIAKLTKIPGIGKKTAERMILELKDRIKTEEAISTNSVEVKQIVKNNEDLQEAMEALKVLGYTSKEIDKAIEKENVEGLKVEDIIKKILVRL